MSLVRMPDLGKTSVGGYSASAWLPDIFGTIDNTVAQIVKFKQLQNEASATKTQAEVLNQIAKDEQAAQQSQTAAMPTEYLVMGGMVLLVAVLLLKR